MNAQRSMAAFSFILGITSIVMLLFGFSLPLAALGLIVALLSRGGESLLPRAKAGLIMSLIGLIIGVVSIVFSLFLIRSGALNDTYDEMREIIETTYSEEEADELIEQFNEILGITPSPTEGGSSK